MPRVHTIASRFTSFKVKVTGMYAAGTYRIDGKLRGFEVSGDGSIYRWPLGGAGRVGRLSKAEAAAIRKAVCKKSKKLCKRMS